MSEQINGRTLAVLEVRRRRPAARPSKTRGGNRPLAYAVGGVGAFVLLLSVWDCTTALHTLTGMPVVLACMLAVGIDCGLVACEMAVVATRRDSDAHRWGERYIGLAVALSVVLNAAAAASHAEGWWKLAGAGVGGVVPVLVYVAGRVAGGLWTGK